MKLNIPSIIANLRRKHGSVYAPVKYFQGLKTRSGVERRYLKMLRGDYKPFPTNKGVRTRRSKYTIAFEKKYGTDAKTLPQISRATGVSLWKLRKVYNRGLAAWRTGHRPGASQHAWAQARVYSFVMGGKTARTADRDLFLNNK
jgi:hypothetical protein